MGQSVSRRSPPQTPRSQPTDSGRAIRDNGGEASSSSRTTPSTTDKQSRRSSRIPTSSSAPSTSSASSSTDNGNGDAIAAPSTASSVPAKRSRRSSLRRSVLGLLPRSQSSSNSLREQYSQSEDPERKKKRWRSSRRWSKAPVRTSTVRKSESDGETRAGQQGRVGDFIRGEGSSELEHNPSPSTDNRPVGPAPTSLPVQPPNTGAPHSPTIDEIHRDISEFLGSHPSPTTTTPAAESNGSANDTRSSRVNAAPSMNPGPTTEQGHDFAQQQLPRQFPPPGTLVVVQGVVNTTDAPNPTHVTAGRGPSSTSSPAPADGSLRRSASAHHPASSERYGGRSRLSSLVPRPNHTVLRQPSSDAATTPETTPDGSSTGASDPSSSATSESATPEDSSHSQQPSDSSASSNAEQDGRPRPLSPGSIDVLGTLLSVAAAATAASLFSPNMVFGGPNLGNSGNPSTINNRPTSPTPTSGLNNLTSSLGGPLGGLTGFGVGPSPAPAQTPEPTAGFGGTATGAQNPRDARDRIRTVWDTLRDRLGLHPRDAPLPVPGTTPPAMAAAATTSNESAPGAGTDSEPRMRPGEFMLAEMARALNMGLGLDGDAARPDLGARRSEPSGTADATTAGSTTDDPSRPLPSEDSFERFLINLQADLRVVLTEGDTAPSGESVQADHTATTTPAPEASTGTEAESETPVLPPSTTDVTDTIQPTIEVTSALEANENLDDDEPPPLQEVSDSSDDELDSEVYVPEISDLHASPRTPTPIPTFGAVPIGPEERANANDRRTDRRPPGINLWRIYRFPPIHADQAQAHAAHTNPTNVAGNTPSHANTTAPRASDAPQAVPAATSSTTTAEQRRSTDSSTTAVRGDANNGVVVPVIVVGLQSVDMAHGHDHEHGDHEAFFPSEPPAGDSTGEALDERESATATPTSMDDPTGQRGRGWHSRAANALRTLRPGRRGASRGRASSEGSGSRTFLIYVIGGYYPPNHHMVTGSDSLDSYEALWELAELLGQVKPPVATREDIDNSGLQIFKSADLQTYETDGRVASNCVDRCLICLDDYEANDELRLMTCKHAFHKDCVDKWLQVGRNNCPACRSKGVSTAGDGQSS